GMVVVDDRAEHAIDEGGRRAGPGGVVDGDDRCGIRDMLERGLDGLPAVLGAAGADRAAEQAKPVGVAELELVKRAGLVGGASDDDLMDARVIGKKFDGSLKDGSSAEILIEFVLLPETGGCSGGGDDDADAHSQMINHSCVF